MLVLYNCHIWMIMKDGVMYAVQIHCKLLTVLNFTAIMHYYYTLNSLSLFWLAESIQWIFEISTCDAITADYTIAGNTGNRVLYDCGAWFLRVITSSSLALFCLSSVKKQKNHYFCFVQCIIKQLLHSVFAIPRIIKVSVRVISFSLWRQLITPTSTLIILDIT